MALDAISTPTYVDDIPFEGRTYWTINGYDTDASTAIEIKAAPGTGKALYLRKIILGSDDADAHPHIQDEDDNVIFGPLFSTVEGPVMFLDLGKGALKLTDNKALELKAAAAGNSFVFILGATANTARA